jgi:hypothetical protein
MAWLPVLQLPFCIHHISHVKEDQCLADIAAVTAISNNCHVHCNCQLTWLCQLLHLLESCTASSSSLRLPIAPSSSDLPATLLPQVQASVTLCCYIASCYEQRQQLTYAATCPKQCLIQLQVHKLVPTKQLVFRKC